MNNYYAIEIEAEFRRREWQRAVEADARAAQVCAGSGGRHWPRLSLISMRSFTVPRVPFTSSLPTRRRTAVC
jgi:hypothetical protein